MPKLTKVPLTIRRRLLLSFLLINSLFAANVGFFVWSNYRRQVAIQALRRDIESEKLFGVIMQKIDNVQKQVTLMGQSVLESSGGLSEEEIGQFRRQLDEIQSSVQEAQTLSSPAARHHADLLAADFGKLRVSWEKFYTDFGVRHSSAITELAVNAEPIGHRIHTQTSPRLLEAVRTSVDEAGATFRALSEWTDRVSLALFGLSGLIALGIAYRFSRGLNLRFEELKKGTAAIGRGAFDQRISIGSMDELGELAQAFNKMADQLEKLRSRFLAAKDELEVRSHQIEKQRQMAEALLLNILPTEIATELQERSSVEPKYFEDVSILFTDFVGFTLSTETMAAEQLVQRLHEYFTAFDEIVERYGLEKLKTVGDSYMCVAGMPTRTPSHPIDTVLAAMEMVRTVEDLGRRPGTPQWAVRIGINTGPVVAGVVGIKKFAFDIWGESVNFGSRMESSGAPNRINISERTYSRIKDFIDCEPRGKVVTKEKREVEMFFVQEVKAELMDDLNHLVPPAFARRYRIYFQRQPPSFPRFLTSLPAEPASPAAAECPLSEIATPIDVMVASDDDRR
jgi:class 3 adenylate cyclase/HAMP domain-containing protein